MRAREAWLETQSKLHAPRGLLARPYFRFFKADLWKPCAFWPDDGQCMQVRGSASPGPGALRYPSTLRPQEECAVCECEPDDMPQSYAEELQQGV